MGAGFPDLVSVWYDPKVITLAGFGTEDGHILAYLRSVRCAKMKTVADRLRYAVELVDERITALEHSLMVDRLPGESFSIAPAWRQILPEVVAIEAKVSNWKSALQQAIRNCIFSHKSFVALPSVIAERVADSKGFALHGVGILSVSTTGEVTVFREARKNVPSVWNYYFHLAAITAKDINDRSK
ncbi:MAG: hypothetical protein U0941_30100 [Planctomycetaceae bacterium]